MKNILKYCMMIKLWKNYYCNYLYYRALEKVIEVYSFVIDTLYYFCKSLEDHTRKTKED